MEAFATFAYMTRHTGEMRRFRKHIYHASLSHVAVSRVYFAAAAMSSSSALCIELVSDHDAPARIDFNADVFEIEAFDIWPTAGGDKNNIGLELMNFRL